MSMIRQLADQLAPMIEAAREDLSVLPNFQVMKGVTERIMADHNFCQIDAARCAMAMKINVQDEDDVQDAINFIMQGFDLMLLTVKALAGVTKFELVLDACRELSVEG